MGIKEPCPDFASVAETAWEKARRRTEIIRKLVENPRRTKTDVREAVGSLGCSVARAYKLMARYVDDPTVSSQLPRRPGPDRGRSHLDAERDTLIDQVIESMYLSHQRP